MRLQTTRMLFLSILVLILSACIEFEDATDENVNTSVQGLDLLSVTNTKVTLTGTYETGCYPQDWNSDGTTDGINESLEITSSSLTHSINVHLGAIDCSGTATSSSNYMGTRQPYAITVDANSVATLNGSGWLGPDGSQLGTGPASESNPSILLSNTFLINEVMGIDETQQSLATYFVVDSSSISNPIIYLATASQAYGYFSFSKVTTTDTGGVVNTGGTGDTFSINGGASFTENGTDPWILANYDSSGDPAGTAIIAMSGYDSGTAEYSELYTISIPGTGIVAPGTYSSADTNPSGLVVFNVDGIFFSDATVATVITIDSVGAVGELIVGSFDATLCNFADLDFTTGLCTAATTNITGSFSVTREADF